ARIDCALLDDSEYAADIVDLVLDGILEIENGGGFVSGADALPLLGASQQTAGGALSRDALAHAQELETDDPQTLAMALYRYNQIPISPFWKTRFAGRDAILAHVGADRGALRTILARDWTSCETAGAWMSWTSIVAPVRHDSDQPTWKLYLSPRPERIR